MYIRICQAVGTQAGTAPQERQIMSALTITHTHPDGTIIEGTAKGDGTAEVLKANRWRWSRYLTAWFIPQSRDKDAKSYQINATASALRAAGFEVDIEIDNTARPAAEVEADRDVRAESRAEAMAAKAERKAAAADAAYAGARAAGDRLPEGGEPIKIGHGSENRHRRDIQKAHNAMGRSVEATREAERAADAAEASRRRADTRNNPVTVGRKIQRLEADARKIDRSLNGYVAHPGSPYAEQIPAATGERREHWEARAAQVADELAHWRGVRAAQVQAGEATSYSREDLAVGDMVKVARSAWWTVKRVNPKTVTVTAGHCEIKAPYTDILDHRTAAQVEEIKVRTHAAKV